MSLSRFRGIEPLYIIMIRHEHAEKKLRYWAQSSKSFVNIEGNRMKIYEQHCLDRFLLDWQEPWSDVVIWDCWNKRHIYTK